jgi:glycosyltransferase involved in cell wall biosynthesis
MKILIFCQYFYPEQFLINEIVQELTQEGHKVTVITGLPNYPSGVIEKSYKNNKRKYETIFDANIIRCPIIARGKNKAQLLLNYLSYMFLAKREAMKLSDDYDVVMLYEMTPITQAYPAIKYCNKKQKKLFMYNCDLAPMCGEEYLGKKGIFASIYGKFSSWAMNGCDIIGVTSKSFIEYNHKINGVPIEKMIYLPQHASDTMSNLNMKSTDNGIADFMFAGNIAGGTGIETIVQAAKELKSRNDFIIHIVGSGSKLNELKQLVHSEELEEKFVFHGRFPMSEMPKLYKIADALLITLRPGQITVPSKLQTYMTTGKPIFGAMDGSGKDVIEDSKCGKCVSAGDYKGLAQLMKSFIENQNLYYRAGINGKEYFLANYTKKHYMNSLIGILQEMAGNK